WCDSLGALCLALPKRDVLAWNFVEVDHHVVPRYVSGRGNPRVDIFQKGKPRFLGPPLDESEIENNQIVGVVHADERGCMEKPVLRQFEYELIKIFRRHAKRIHQCGLDSAGYFCDPLLVVTPFKDVDFS